MKILVLIIAILLLGCVGVQATMNSTLNSPADLYRTSDTNITFNWTLTTDGSVTTIPCYLWVTETGDEDTFVLNQSIKYCSNGTEQTATVATLAVEHYQWRIVSGEDATQVNFTSTETGPFNTTNVSNLVFNYTKNGTFEQCNVSLNKTDSFPAYNVSGMINNVCNFTATNVSEVVVLTSQGYGSDEYILLDQGNASVLLGFAGRYNGTQTNTTSDARWLEVLDTRNDSKFRLTNESNFVAMTVDRNTGDMNLTGEANVSSLNTVGDGRIGRNLTVIDRVTSTNIFSVLINATNAYIANLEANLDGTGFNFTVFGVFANLINVTDFYAANLESNLDGTGYNLTLNNLTSNLTDTVLLEAEDARVVDLFVTGNSTFTGNYSNFSQERVLVFDEQSEVHNLVNTLTHWDELTDDLIYDSTSSTIASNGTNTSLNVSSNDGSNLEVNINRIIYDVGYPSMRVWLTNGINESPQINYVTVQIVGGSPVLRTEATYPTAEHVDIAQVLVGDQGYVVSNFPNLYRTYEATYEFYERFEDEGSVYLSGFGINESTDTILNISTGNYKTMTREIDTANELKMSEGYFWIRSNGTYQWCTDLSCIDAYSDGTAFGATRRMNVVWGVVAFNRTQGALVAVVQGYPGAGNEYINADFAEQDRYSVTEFFPSDSNLRKSYIPLVRTIVSNPGDDFELFASGLYYRFLGGIVSGGGASPSPGTTVHSVLSNLNWSVSGHVIDEDVNISSQNLTDVDCVRFKSGGSFCDSP